jgi:hypothetical protein
MSTPATALAASRVDLIERIRAGIPEPAHVPGGEPWLRAGKRYLIPAPAGTGKSLAALIVAVTVVEHGGRAIILDVENGADEYARRLEDILRARDHDDTVAEACRERLHYHDWPRFSLSWKPDAWAHAVAGADLIVFDSSRLALSSVGLAEDSNDDYSRFVTALVVPLAKHGATTIVLDNTGHTGTHARGASSKADLNEVVYLLKAGAPFDRDQAGHLRLVRDRTRFSGLPRELHIHVGADTYTAPAIADSEDSATGFRPTTLMEKASRVIEETPGLPRNAILAATGGKKDYAAQAVAVLIAEHYVRVEPGPNRATHHHSEKPYRAVDDIPNSVGPEWVPSGSGPTGQVGPEGVPPLRGTHRGHRHQDTQVDPENGDPPSEPLEARAETLFARHGDDK